MMGSKVRSFAPLSHVSLDDLVPSDPLYRHLDRCLDLSFVRDLVHGAYASGGRPSIDPVVFFKLQLIMFFEGLRSERQLLRVAADRLSLRWYLGYDLDDPLPDHSSLTRIRTRLGLPIFQHFFEHVVELCRASGLVWGQELFIDATKIRANADIDSLVPRWYQQAKAHLAVLFQAAEEETVPPDESYDGPLPEPVTQPSVLPTPAAVAAELAAANQTCWRLLEHYRLDPARPASKGYRRTTDDQVSLTDPDAVPMKHHVGDRVKLGYHNHGLVDGGKARIILAVLVTPADVMENQAMLDLLWRVRFRWHLHPRFIAGDTTYGTIENIAAVERDGIRAYVRLPAYERRTPYFPKSVFVYDAARDSSRCPQGQELRRTSYSRTDQTIKYLARAKVCNGCPVKAQCTPGKSGRKIDRSFDEA